jgi:hypothetical protein
MGSKAKAQLLLPGKGKNSGNAMYKDGPGHGNDNCRMQEMTTNLAHKHKLPADHSFDLGRVYFAFHTTREVFST